jgi:hypothetical protein
LGTEPTARKGVRTMATTGQERIGADDDASSVVTRCGRTIRVRCMHLATPDHPINRVTLDVGQERGGESGAWAALTPDEARRLARLLLDQVGLAEESTHAG